MAATATIPILFSVALMNGAQILQSGSYGVVPTTWSVVGQRDFNRDGRYDLIWRDSSGNIAIWLLNGLQVLQTGGLGNVPATWRIAGTADFNGDGKGDLLWIDSSPTTRKDCRARQPSKMDCGSWDG
jgi:serralysin